MPYRNERTALEARRADLQRDIAALERRSVDLASVTADVESLRRELATIESRLATRSLRRSLPQLDDLHVASPCSASWAAMTGDDRVRFCGECNKNVYNLSAMTSAEADAVIVASEGKLCVRFYRRADGTVMTTDCPVGVKRKRRRRALVATTVSVLAAAGAAWATTGHGGENFVRPFQAAKQPIEMLMGDIAAPPTPTPPEPPHRPTMGHVSRPHSVEPQSTPHPSSRGSLPARQ